MEQDSEEQVRQEVREALRILGPGGGFVLSPVDNVRDASEKTWGNVRAMIDEWRRRQGRAASVTGPPATGGASQ